MYKSANSRKSMVKRAALGILGVALMLAGGMNSYKSVQANESVSSINAPGVTAYATTKQLKDPNNFTLSDENGTGAVQKVYFGSRGTGKQTWYIAGYDEVSGGLVLLCDPSKPLLSSLAFDTTTGGKEYKTEWGCKYDGSIYISKVNSNHYGGSTIRQKLLKRIVNTAVFTTAEQGRLKSVKVYTMDGYEGYTVTDKAYLPAYGSKSQVYVGSSNSGVPNGPIVVAMAGTHAPEGSPYVDETNKSFWLRTAYGTSKVYVTTPGVGADKKGNTETDINMVPAIHLSLSNVLFASCAKPAMAGSTIAPGMTLRYRSEQTSGNKIVSIVEYTDTEIQIHYSSQDGQKVFLYVAGNNGEKDFVYSRAVTKSENIKGTSFHSTITNLSKCKIWLETLDTASNLVYAKEAIRTIRISEQPKDQLVDLGKEATFSVRANGTGLNYQWESSNDGGVHWTTIAGAAASMADYTFTTKDYNYGSRYRCVVSDSNGHSVISNSANLTLVFPFGIKTDLPDVWEVNLDTFESEVTKNLSINVNGTGIVYQWQECAAGSSTWKNLSGNGFAHSIPVTFQSEGKKYRCIMTDIRGNKLTSNECTISVKVAIVIKKQPQKTSICQGGTGYVSVEATGWNLIYQWYQYDSSSKQFRPVSDASGQTAKLKVEGTERGTQEFYCRIKGEKGTVVNTEHVLVSIVQPFEIWNWARDVHCKKDQESEVSVALTGGSIDVSYQWQYSTDGGKTFRNCTGEAAKKQTYRFIPNPALGVDFYRCAVSQYGLTLYTPLIPVIWENGPVITQSLKPVYSAYLGDYMDITLKAEGEGLTYEWQISFVNPYGYMVWVPFGAMDNGRSRLRICVDQDMLDISQFIRCIVTDKYGYSVISAPARIQPLTKLQILSQTGNVTAKENEMVTLQVKANGPVERYAWEYSDNGGRTWKMYEGEGKDTSSIRFKVESWFHTRVYRCWLYAGYEWTADLIESEWMAISVPGGDPGFIRQPDEILRVIEGEKMEFEVKFLGEVASYQWYYRLDDGDSQKMNTTSGKTSKMVTTAKRIHDWMEVWCVVTTKDGSQYRSKYTVVRVTAGIPKIVKQPTDVTVKAGEKAIFKVEASGEITGYQWEYSTDQGKTWKTPTAASAKTPTFSTSTKLSQNGLKVRCKVIGKPRSKENDYTGMQTENYTNIVTLYVK